MTFDVNDLVVQWLDRSGSGNHAAQLAGGWRPAYIESAINGHPAIDFAGAGIHLDVADSDDINKDDVYTAKTLLVVFKTGANLTEKQIVWEQGGTKKGGLSFYTDHGVLYINGWAQNTTDAFPEWGQGGSTVNAAVTPNTVYVASLVLNTAANTFAGFVNGGWVGTFSPCLELPKHTNDCAFGHNEKKSRFVSGGNASLADFEGLIAEFYSYNAVLTTAQREAVEAYLMDKYGL
jgi:hypothetical protein